MIISLVGMSGSGKTFWSKKLSEAGFKRFGCDDLIESKLSDELIGLGFSGIADMSKWMGQPYEDRYQKTSQTYLDLENKVMEEVLSEISKNQNGNIVLDTTGSVIYTHPKIQDEIKKMTQVIYLEVPEEVKDEMFKLYLEDPKPVIWGGSFKVNKNKDKIDSLKKCYPGLLEYRGQKYEQLAHKTFDYHALRKDGFDIDSFIGLLSK